MVDYLRKAESVNREGWEGGSPISLSALLKIASDICGDRSVAMAMCGSR
jgi:hypothetical protein